MVTIDHISIRLCSVFLTTLRAFIGREEKVSFQASLSSESSSFKEESLVLVINIRGSSSDQYNVLFIDLNIQTSNLKFKIYWKSAS